jgi:hypothetical protein
MRLYFYVGKVISLMPQPPLFVWVVTFDLSGMGDSTSSNATAGLALRLILPHESTTAAK